MRRVEDIERQICELSTDEFSELRRWMLERDWDCWDAQVEADAESGKLNRLLAEADADYEAGQTRPL
jgi:hypothetical protein